MKIMIREGSSARNLEDLFTVGGEFLVSDDRHPEDLLEGHMDQILRNSVDLGMDPIEALKMVTAKPAKHYHLNCGTLKPGTSADIVLVDDLEDFNVHRVWIGGELVAEEGKPLFRIDPLPLKSTFSVKNLKSSDFEVHSSRKKETVRVIEVIEGQLLTHDSEAILQVIDDSLQVDVENDILKIAVVERYGHNHISNAFVKGFKLKNGAIASSVAHDSHNIIVVGTGSQEMAEAANIVSRNMGGLVAVADGKSYSLKLPIAGLMSTMRAGDVSSQLNKLHDVVNDMGSNLTSPFMTLSFMALLVIPKLKISDLGLFDGEKFQFVDVIK
jgi:adenine deaminase